MPKKDTDTTWRATFDIPVPGDFSIEAEISWPNMITLVPTLSVYENPDTGQLRIEIFATKKPADREIEIIRETLSSFLGSTAPQFKFKKLAQKDWVTFSLKDLESIEAGRFFIHGSHLKNKIPSDKIPLLIDAGFAFGTGHHETTKGCLLALDRLAEKIKPQVILDLGCGTGILAFAAKKLWPSARVFAGDVDLEAVRTARQNAEKNKVPDVEVCLAEGFDAPNLRTASFDLITANILAGPLMDLAPGMAARMNKGGYLILSGLLKTHEENVLHTYEDTGFRHTDTVTDKTWPTVILEKIT